MKTNIRDYSEGLDVELKIVEDRIVIQARNEGGHNRTEVDLLDVFNFLGINIRKERIAGLIKRINDG